MPIPPPKAALFHVDSFGNIRNALMSGQPIVSTVYNDATHQVRIEERVHGPEAPPTLIRKGNLGAVLQARGALEAAEALQREVRGWMMEQERS